MTVGQLSTPPPPGTRGGPRTHPTTIAILDLMDANPGKWVIIYEGLPKETGRRRTHWSRTYGVTVTERRQPDGTYTLYGKRGEPKKRTRRGSR